MDNNTFILEEDSSSNDINFIDIDDFSQLEPNLLTDDDISFSHTNQKINDASLNIIDISQSNLEDMERNDDISQSNLEDMERNVDESDTDSSYYSDDDSDDRLSCVSRLSDIDTTWVDTIEKYQEFYNDYPSSLKVKLMLINDKEEIIWIGKDDIILDNNGILENRYLKHYINNKTKELNLKIQQKIELVDIQLFQCNISEDVMYYYLRSSNSNFNKDITFKQKSLTIDSNVSLRPSISFFHHLNSLVIVFRSIISEPEIESEVKPKEEKERIQKLATRKKKTRKRWVGNSKRFTRKKKSK